MMDFNAKFDSLHRITSGNSEVIEL